MKQLLFIFVIITTVIVISCTDKKGTNPLTENNLPPTLELVGFGADTLVFVANRAYPFEFIAKDEGSKEPQVSAKAVGETGTITIVGKTAQGLYTAQFTPNAKGRHIIEVSVSDGLETVTETMSIFFGDNREPVAVIQFQEIARDVQNVRFTYEFDASQSTDKDSRITKATWNLDGFIVSNPVDQKLQHTFNYYANYQIELTVEDEFGGLNTASVTIDNSKPLASFIIRPDDQGKNGDQITLDATASTSPNGAIVNYTWFRRNTLQGLDVLAAQITENILRYTVNLAVGSNQFGLVVRDAEGNLSDTTWVDFTVLNQPPQAAFAFQSELERIIITDNQSQDTDPGDTIGFSWALNGTPIPEKDNEALPTFDVRGDVYQLTLTAIDNHGDSSATTRTVSVPGVPEAHFIFPDGVEDDFEARNGQAITIDAETSIAGNESAGIDTYTWFFRASNGPVEQLAENDVDFIVLNINHELGDYEVGLKVTNLEGLESTTTWRNLIVINSNPSAEFTCEFEAFAEGIVYRILTNDSSDPDPNDTISFRWFLDGVEQTGVTEPTPTFTRNHAEPVNTITLRVEDSFGGMAEKSVNGACNQ